MGHASLLALRGFTQVGLAASLRACRKDSRIRAGQQLRWLVQKRLSVDDVQGLEV